MIIKNRFINTLVGIGTATVLLISFSDCTGNKDETVTIKGVAAEKFEGLSEQKWGPEGMMPGGGFGPGGPGGGPGVMPGEPGGDAGMHEGMPGGPGGPGGGVQPTPAVYIDNGEYVEEKSGTSAVMEGEIEDSYAYKVIIDAEDADTGGVYVTGPKSRFTLTGANIELSGDGGRGLGGTGTGAIADDHSTLILRNVNITANGVGRSATSAENFSTLIVNNCTLRANGVPFDSTDISPPGPLEMEGNARAHVTMSGSESYFYNSTIISEGWGALSTDASGGYVYLEANNCDIRSVKSGYGTYADHYCMDVFNDCKVYTGSYTAILDKNGIIYINNTDAISEKNYVLLHNSGMPATVISTLKIKGGSIDTKEAVLNIKSTNSDITFDGVKIVSGNNILIQSQINEDESLPRPSEGQKVYGIHASFRDMDVAGDIVHNDPERNIYVNLESTILKGAINDEKVYITIDKASKWIATADSQATIVGSVEVAQIDAPAGVTINAVAGESGTYTLASGGTLILKAS